MTPKAFLNYFLLILFLLGPLSLSAQITTFQVDFERDVLGAPPFTVAGNGQYPTGLFGEAASSFSVAPLQGMVGNSTAFNQVVEVQVPETGDFRLVDFDGFLNSGIVTEDTVWVSFDFFLSPDTSAEGFAFLRNYDDQEASFADIGFNFNGDRFSVGLLDYDPSSGTYLGWRDLPAPNSSFAAGTWHRLEAIIDLNNNKLRLQVDGQDAGVEAGISRATGLGYAGAYLNFGSAFEGKCAIDNIQVEVSDKRNLPSPPAGFTDLLEPEDHGGQVLRLPRGDFRSKGIEWNNSALARLVYDSIYAGVTAYRLIPGDLDESDGRLFSVNSFPIQANRTYEVSALIRANFPRATWEVNLGMMGADDNNEIAQGARYAGLPAITQGPDGWERWTWRFTPHWDDRYNFANVFLGFHEFGPGYNDAVSFEIADLAFVELPAVPLTAFAPGTGVTFPGGPGSLPMQIDTVEVDNNRITVETSGARFVFSLFSNTIRVAQQIDYRRTLAGIRNLSLTGLAVQSQSATEVVLVGDELTIGIQVDGTMVISPHQEVDWSIESEIGGDFNRLSGGDLLCQDDFGGFTVNIHTPKGTGLIPRLSLDNNNIDFSSIAPDDLISLGAAERGWTATASLSPGERLFVSAFPSRPYDWEKSFEYQWGLSDYNQPIEYDQPEYMSTWILWNISQRAWAMSFGERYEIRDDVPYQDHWDAILAEGDNWSAYFSQWFYYSRDALEWVNEVKRWRDTYGMGAVYSDGMAQDDWLVAYEAMRRLRADVFPDGDILIHDSYPQSGVAAAAFRPFIYSYATSTYMGENALSSAGAEWAWARYAMGQFRRSNALGVTKGDGWTDFDDIDKYLVALVWGGRGRPDVPGYQDTYLPILAELKQLWETYGDDPYFFDRYYHPDAQVLTGYDIGRVGMPIFQIDTLQNGSLEVRISSRTPNAKIYITDGLLDPDSSYGWLYNGSPIPWDGHYIIKARAFRSDLDESRLAIIGHSLRANTEETDQDLRLPKLVSIFPNPAQDQTTIRYYIPTSQEVQIRITDVSGKVIRSYDQGNQSSGYHLLSVNKNDLAAGLYFIYMHADQQLVAPKRMVFTH